MPWNQKRKLLWPITKAVDNTVNQSKLQNKHLCEWVTIIGFGLKEHSLGWTVWKVLLKFFNFVVCNPCQSSPSLTILVPLWFVIISLVFFYLCKVLFSRFLQFNGNFVDAQNNWHFLTASSAKYRLTPSHDRLYTHNSEEILRTTTCIQDILFHQLAFNN